MAYQVEDFDNALPNRLTVERLFHRHAFAVRSLRTVQLLNDGFEFPYLAHGFSSFGFSGATSMVKVNPTIFCKSDKAFRAFVNPEIVWW